LVRRCRAFAGLVVRALAGAGAVGAVLFTARLVAPGTALSATPTFFVVPTLLFFATRGADFFVLPATGRILRALGRLVA
jgi:hypothetical protein